TAVCAAELARRFRVNLLLVGRSDPPVLEPVWLKDLFDEAAIKQAIMKEHSSNLSPKDLNRTYQHWMKNRELMNNLDRFTSMGVQVRYESADVTNREKLVVLTNRLKKENIIIRGLLHGAGIIADKLAVDKTLEDFDRVIRTKVESLRIISECLDLEQLKVLVLFSSSTARFGRKGQIDYAMANEVLNKFAHKFSALYPACRTLAINWGPWDGGMVTPELKNVFLAEGIPLIDPASGALYLSRELRMEYGRTVIKPVEIVIIGTSEQDVLLPGDRKPIADETRIDTEKPDQYSGTESEGFEASEPEGEGESEEDDAAELQEVYRLIISDDRLPVLKSHLINGMPVVPMALLMEFAAQGAMIRHPSLLIHGIENFRLLKGIVLRSGMEFELECKTGESEREGRLFRIPVELRGVMPDGKRFVHVSAEVILAPRLPAPPAPPTPLDRMESYPIHQEQLYSEVLFHGEKLQSIRAVEGVSESGIVAAVDGAPAPIEWMNVPIADTWLTDPMSIDASFQLMILWTELMLDMPSLPCGFATYRQFRKNLPAWAVADIRVKEHRGNQVFADIYFKDEENQVVAMIESYQCITDKGLRDAFKIRRMHE
ncbi:KR domain-containing protein, partial [bacterium]|nr:KR domain-containing protein [candidate division CSSED10-310 bacterium]